jgi:hypothetical protein
LAAVTVFRTSELFAASAKRNGCVRANVQGVDAGRECDLTDELRARDAFLRPDFQDSIASRGSISRTS